MSALCQKQTFGVGSNARCSSARLAEQQTFKPLLNIIGWVWEALSSWSIAMRLARRRALSRRTVVVRSLTVCAAEAAALLAPIKEAAAKMAQKIAEYQDTPKGDQQCSNCSLFQEPNACTLVDGEISPAGWCKFWVKKTG